MTRYWLILAVVLVCGAGCGEDWKDAKTTVHSACNESVDVTGHIIRAKYGQEYLGGESLDELQFTDQTYIRAHGLARAYPLIRMDEASTAVRIERREIGEWWFVPIDSDGTWPVFKQGPIPGKVEAQ